MSNARPRRSEDAPREILPARPFAYALLPASPIHFFENSTVRPENSVLTQPSPRHVCPLSDQR